MTPLKGLHVCFTGRMEKVRSEMEAEARNLGAWVTNTVDRHTNILVTGKNVGRVKIEAAREKGVDVISVSEYRDLIAQKMAMLTNTTERKDVTMINPVAGVLQDGAVRF